MLIIFLIYFPFFTLLSRLSLLSKFWYYKSSPGHLWCCQCHGEWFYSSLVLRQHHIMETGNETVLRFSTEVFFTEHEVRREGRGEGEKKEGKERWNKGKGEEWWWLRRHWEALRNIHNILMLDLELQVLLSKVLLTRCTLVFLPLLRKKSKSFWKRQWYESAVLRQFGG